ncbi:MAG TPA: hypothetical protein VFG50_14815, partial [Rhodothermales bacterium]|nr:hypothetical protein [Rhodothermales bacterium]
MPRLPAVLLVFLLSLALSCSSARQITTAPPVSGIPRDTTQAVRSESRLTLVFDIGRTPLPEDIQSVRFRISGASLKQSGASWISVPVDRTPLAL